MKSKRLWIAIALIIFFLFIAGFHQKAAAFIGLFFNLTEPALDTLEKWLSVVSNGLAIFTSVIFGLGWLIKQWRGEQPDSERKGKPEGKETVFGNTAVFHGKVKMRDFVQGNKTNQHGGDDV